MRRRFASFAHYYFPLHLTVLSAVASFWRQWWCQWFAVYIRMVFSAEHSLYDFV